MRMTRQKTLILQIVYTLPGHPTVQDVYRQAVQHMPRISLATVYRNLEQLVQRGLLRKLTLSDQVTRFDTNTGKHYHIRCAICGKVEDLPMSFMEEINEKISQFVNYEVWDHQLEVVGRCPACRNRRMWERRRGSKS